MVMSENKLAQKFVSEAKQQWGSRICIRRGFACVAKGEPDIQGVLNGMPFFLEVKEVNPVSFKTNHPFSKIQIRMLKDLEEAGAFAYGLLIKEPFDCRVISPKDIPESGIIIRDRFEKCGGFYWGMLISKFMEDWRETLTLSPELIALRKESLISLAGQNPKE